MTMGSTDRDHRIQGVRKMKDQFEGSHQGKQDAMDMAESARESTWRLSFMAEMFAGNFRSDLIFPYPEQDPADKREGDAFLAKLESFLLNRVDADEIDRTGEIPKDVIQGLMDLGAFGMKIDKQYGGLGLSHTNYVRALTLTGSHCGN